jgi:tetratricopeptide (TPR) repeat protein
MRWGAPLPESVAPPAVVVPLLARAIAASPENSALHAKLGYAELDRKDYPAAAASFETALRLDPGAAHLRPLTARCYNYLGRHGDAVEVLAGVPAADFERARALMDLGAAAAAEEEFKAVLAADPNHKGACRMLFRLLRRAGRKAELVPLCEGLAARGADNGQLLYNWGWALALAGDGQRARRLMYEPERIVRAELTAPPGFSSIAALNAALAEDILANPNDVGRFPEEDEANRGSRRIDNLYTGRRPELIDLLLDAIRNVVMASLPVPRDGFDPWPRARPAAVRPRPWGLIQRRSDYEAGHVHPGGWLSGVYYVRVPAAVSQAKDGRGCIEFGPPGSVAQDMPGLAPAGRYVPHEGLLLLAPSHYQHRTIPSGVDEQRISIAFDLVPERDEAVDGGQSR